MADIFEITIFYCRWGQSCCNVYWSWEWICENWTCKGTQLAIITVLICNISRRVSKQFARIFFKMMQIKSCIWWTQYILFIPKPDFDFPMLWFFLCMFTFLLDVLIVYVNLQAICLKFHIHVKHVHHTFTAFIDKWILMVVTRHFFFK